MTRTVVVAGVGPGLGESLARKFAVEGCRVALLARTESYVDGLAADLESTAGEAFAVPTDLTDRSDVEAAFEAVRERFGPVDVLVNHASGGAWKGLLDLSTAQLDHALDVSVRAGFWCSQEAAADMLDGDADDEGKRGTIVFTGATSAVRGRENALAFSAAKFAVRGMAQSMARELGDEGIHVAHVVLDGGILPPDREVANPEEYLDPDDIARRYWHLVEQDVDTMDFEVHVTNGNKPIEFV